MEIVRELEHGRDIPVDELSREHIRSYFDTLKHLPCRLCGQRQFTGKGWLQLADMGRSGQIERLLSVKTMEVRQTNVRSFVNWCELEYRGAVQAKYVNSGFPKVLSDKDIRRKGVKRESFTQDELKALFGDMRKYVQATEGVSSRFWAPLIALYSGMRLEEICQLHLSDIVKGGSRRDQKAVVPGQIVEIGFADLLLQKELRHHIDVKHMGTALAVTKLHNLA